MNRRQFLQQLVVVGASGAGLYALSACTKSAQQLSCEDVSALSEADKTMRTTLQYVDHSTEPGKVCSGCSFYQPSATPNACGGCTLVKGPINPAGNCKSFVAKKAA